MAFTIIAAGSLAPYAVHACWIVPYAASFGPPEQEPLGLYPGLLAFATMAGALWLAGVWFGGRAAAVYPPSLAVLPTLYGAAYYLLLLLPIWDRPSFLLIDNVPLIWLAVWSLAFGLAVLLLRYFQG